jgi:hypothetical protein
MTQSGPPGATGQPVRPRFRRCALLIVTAILGWAACGVWNCVKPMPPGTHVDSLPARLAESEVDFIADEPPGATLLNREREAIARAERILLLDQSPVVSELAQQLLSAKRQRPNLTVILATDPRNEVYGGTPGETLGALERAGIIVARTRLERMRDSKPLYSSWWRLAVAWWSDPFDEVPGRATWLSSLRQRNAKANCRQLLVADDGAGGWTTIVTSGPAVSEAGRSSNIGLEIRGHLAHAIIASELRIAAWSTDDDRLPAPPPPDSRGVGTIDARFITEGATAVALHDLAAVAAAGDSIDLMGRALQDRGVIAALQDAAARGAHLRLLLDPARLGSRAAAAELLRGASERIEVRWQAAPPSHAHSVMIRHRDDVWLDLGSADFARRSLEDLDLEADIELHLPARAAPVRAAAEFFTKAWSRAAPYGQYADDSAQTYWRYRLEEFSGLALLPIPESSD